MNNKTSVLVLIISLTMIVIVLLSLTVKAQTSDLEIFADQNNILNNSQIQFIQSSPEQFTIKLTGNSASIQENDIFSPSNIPVEFEINCSRTLKGENSALYQLSGVIKTTLDSEEYSGTLTGDCSSSLNGNVNTLKLNGNIIQKTKTQETLLQGQLRGSVEIDLSTPDSNIKTGYFTIQYYKTETATTDSVIKALFVLAKSKLAYLSKFLLSINGLAVKIQSDNNSQITITQINVSDIDNAQNLKYLTLAQKKDLLCRKITRDNLKQIEELDMHCDLLQGYCDCYPLPV